MSLLKDAVPNGFCDLVHSKQRPKAFFLNANAVKLHYDPFPGVWAAQIKIRFVENRTPFHQFKSPPRRNAKV